jgi:hypothetical protein
MGLAKSMFAPLSLPILLLLFAGAATFVWVAGIRLSDTSDVLSSRLALRGSQGCATVVKLIFDPARDHVPAVALLAPVLPRDPFPVLNDSPAGTFPTAARAPGFIAGG